MYSDILLHKGLGFVHTLEALQAGEMYSGNNFIGVGTLKTNTSQNQNNTRRQI